MPRKQRNRARRRAKRLKAAAEQTWTEHEEATLLHFPDQELQGRQITAYSKSCETDDRRWPRLADAAVTLSNEVRHSFDGPAFSPLPASEGAAGDGPMCGKGSGTGSVDSALLLASPSHKEEQLQLNMFGREKGGKFSGAFEQGEEDGDVSPSSTDSGVGWDGCSDSCRGRASPTTNSSRCSRSSAHATQYQPEHRTSSSEESKGGDSSVESTDGGGGWDGYSYGTHLGVEGTSTGSSSGDGGYKGNESYERRGEARGGGGRSTAEMARGSWSEEDPGIGQDLVFRTSSSGYGTGWNHWPAADDRYSDYEGDGGVDESGSAESEVSPPLTAVTGDQDGWMVRATVKEIAEGRGSAVEIGGDSTRGTFAGGDNDIQDEDSVRTPSCRG